MAVSRPSARPAAGITSVVGLPPVAMRYVPATASTKHSASEANGSRRSRTQMTPSVMGAPRLCITVAVAAFVTATFAK